MKFVVLLGAPGSGKGTQAQLLQEKHHYVKISTGEILRSEIDSGSDLGKMIKQIVEAGDLINDDLMIDILKSKVTSKIEKASGFILDGFPRNVNQAVALDKMLDTMKFQIDKVIYLEIETNKLLDRITKRYVCSSCGANYNEVYKNTKEKGICDSCGSKDLIHRADDNEETVRNRLEIYMAQTAPLLPYYERENKLIRVNGDKEIGQVTASINDSLFA